MRSEILHFDDQWKAEVFGRECTQNERVVYSTLVFDLGINIEGEKKKEVRK